MEKKKAVAAFPKSRSKFAESFMAKYGFKMLLSILTILVFLTCVRCTVKKPESPVWNMNLVLPVINRTYDMEEIVNKIEDPGLTLDASDTITFTFDETLDTIRIEEDLTIDSLINYVADSVGKITISPTNPDPILFDPADFGIYSNIPGFPIGWLNTVSFDLPSFDIFNWATLSTGAIQIEVINNFGIDLDIVSVDLVDRGYSRITATGNFTGTPAIPDGDTVSLTLNLAGKTISNRLGITIRCHTSGTTGWWYVDDKEIIVNMGFDGDLLLSAAETVIPPIPPIDLSERLLVELNHTVLSANLSSGNLKIELENNSPLSATLSMILPDINLDGVPFSLDTTVYPQSITVIQLDLIGYTFEPFDQVIPQFMDFNATVTLEESSDLLVIRETDDVKVTTIVAGLAFDSMECRLTPTEVVFDDLGQIDIDIPDGFDEFQLASAVLELEIVNSFNFPGALDLTINGDAGQTPLHISSTILAGTQTNPSVNIIIDSNLSTFLNPVPNYVTISGSATFGNGSTTGFITGNDYLSPSLSIIAPLEIIIDSATFSADTTSEDIDQEDVTLITEHLIEANFSSTVNNSLPVSVRVKIFMDGDSTKMNDSAEVVKIIEVNADSLSEVSLVLDSSEIKVMENNPLYVSQDIMLIGNGIDPVMILKSDSLSILGIIEIEYHFDGSF